MGYGSWDKEAAAKAALGADRELREMRDAAKNEAAYEGHLISDALLNWWARWFMACGHKALWKIVCNTFAIDPRNVEGQRSQEEFKS